MLIESNFLKKVMSDAKAEQDMLRLRHARQEGAIALCEILLKKLAEEEAPKEQ